MKLVYVLISLFIVSGGGFVFYARSQSTAPQKLPVTPQTTTSSPVPTNKAIDYQAGFAIFTNGTLRVFTAAMYHNLSKDAFIQSDNPNIVRIKKIGVTWDDFFKTLPFTLTKDCLTTGTKQTFCTNNNGSLRFYLNGKQNPNALDKQIENGDLLLVSFGNENEAQIQEQLKQIPKIN